MGPGSTDRLERTALLAWHRQVPRRIYLNIRTAQVNTHRKPVRRTALSFCSPRLPWIPDENPNRIKRMRNGLSTLLNFTFYFQIRATLNFMGTSGIHGAGDRRPRNWVELLSAFTLPDQQWRPSGIPLTGLCRPIPENGRAAHRSPQAVEGRNPTANIRQVWAY